MKFPICINLKKLIQNPRYINGYINDEKLHKKQTMAVLAIVNDRLHPVYFGNEREQFVKLYEADLGKTIMITPEISFKQKGTQKVSFLVIPYPFTFPEDLLGTYKFQSWNCVVATPVDCITVSAFILAAPLTVFAAETKNDKSVNYDKKDDIIVVSTTDEVSANLVENNDNNEPKDKGDVSAQTIVPFPAGFACTAGFDVDYDQWWIPWDGNSDVAFGETTLIDVTGVIDCDLTVSGTVWKNGGLYQRIATKNAYQDTYIKASAGGDWSPNSGDSYGVTTYHYAWDDAANQVLNHETNDDMVY